MVSNPMPSAHVIHIAPQIVGPNGEIQQVSIALTPEQMEAIKNYNTSTYAI